ncbi:hypothetical protein J6590_104435 [Homalodisca vitripennis]|nr:hypothetical protein J6590_104435 [Homalodisca vitripennis]
MSEPGDPTLRSAVPWLGDSSSDNSSSDDDLVLLYSVAQRDHWYKFVQYSVKSTVLHLCACASYRSFADVGQESLQPHIPADGGRRDELRPKALPTRRLWWLGYALRVEGAYKGRTADGIHVWRVKGMGWWGNEPFLLRQVSGAARPIYSRPYLALASPGKDIRSGSVVSPHQTQSLHIDV